MPGIDDRLAEFYDKLKDQNKGFIESVEDLQKQLKEAFVLLDAAHNKALRERSDLKIQFEGIHEQIIDL